MNEEKLMKMMYASHILAGLVANTTNHTDENLDYFVDRATTLADKLYAKYNEGI